jgi:hypothetical protein
MKCILEHSFKNEGKLKVLNILSTELINIHHKRQHDVSQVNYVYTLWLGYTKFTKKLEAISKNISERRVT